MSSKKSKEIKKQAKKAEKKKNNSSAVLQQPAQHHIRSPYGGLYAHHYLTPQPQLQPQPVTYYPVVNGSPTVVNGSQQLPHSPPVSPAFYRPATQVPHSAPLPATSKAKQRAATTRYRHSFHQQVAFPSYSAPVLQTSSAIPLGVPPPLPHRSPSAEILPSFAFTEEPKQPIESSITVPTKKAKDQENVVITPNNAEMTNGEHKQTPVSEEKETPLEAIGTASSSALTSSSPPATRRSSNQGLLRESLSSPSIFNPPPSNETEDEIMQAADDLLLEDADYDPQLRWGATKKVKDAQWVEREIERQRATLEEIISITSCKNESLIMRLFAKNRGNKQATLNEYFDSHRGPIRTFFAPINNTSTSTTTATTSSAASNTTSTSLTPPTKPLFPQQPASPKANASEARNNKENNEPNSKKEEKQPENEIIEIDSTVDDEIDQWMQIDNLEQNEAKRKDLANRLFRMMIDATPTDFEKHCKALFEAQSYKVVHSGKRGDHGIDLELTKGGMRYVCQCKRYQAQKVSEGALRDFYGVMTDARAIRGFFITTSTFTTCARKWCEDKPSIVLIDHQALCLLLEEYGEKMEKRLLKINNTSTS
eukprot:TRINITY_DN5685_c0_g1_i1.p1 TRINITY_DN5685_c0_g1~~TRINITY_DN5685_c0_g1_i1.p1  ORF type:complete len:594 (+),score=160.43 TRINITY_DN5685_c0_g1_i1:338-2119(+)